MLSFLRMFKSWNLFILLAFTIGCVYGILIEKWVKPCDFKQDNYSACVKERFQELVGKIGSKGIKELGLVSLDPLKVDFMQLAQTGNSAAKLKMNFTEISVWGLDKLKVQDYLWKPNHEINVKIFVPSYKIEGKYDMSGKILTFPLTGSGPFRINAYDFEVDTIVQLGFKKNKGKTYLITKDLHLDLKFALEKTRVYFGNILNNKEFTDNMNLILNENIKDVAEEVLPLLRESFELTFKNIIEMFHEHAPVEEIILNGPTGD